MDSTLGAQKNAQKAQSPSIYDWDQFELPREFPMQWTLGGVREHEALWTPHVHNAMEIGCCHEGEGSLWVETKILRYQAGDITVITNRERHRSQPLKHTQSRWSWFFLDPVGLLTPKMTPRLIYRPELISGPEFPNVFSPKEHPQLTDIVLQMVAEAHDNRPSCQESMRALVLVFLNRLNDLFARARPYEPDKERPHEIARLLPAIDELTVHYDTPLTISRLATLCGMSLRSFQLNFRRVFGQSPRDYLMEFRIRTAATMLESERQSNIAEIGFHVGFQTLSCFNRAFVKVLGCSPREYRRRAVERTGPDCLLVT